MGSSKGKKCKFETLGEFIGFVPQVKWKYKYEPYYFQGDYSFGQQGTTSNTLNA